MANSQCWEAGNETFLYTTWAHACSDGTYSIFILFYFMAFFISCLGHWVHYSWEVQTLGVSWQWTRFCVHSERTACTIFLQSGWVKNYTLSYSSLTLTKNRQTITNSNYNNRQKNWDTKGHFFTILCRCCRLCSHRNRKINIVSLGGEVGENVSRLFENRILPRSIWTVFVTDCN